MRLFGLQNSVSEIAGNVHSQSKEAFNEAKKNVGNAIGFATMAAGGLGAMSGGASMAGGGASMAGGGSAPGAVANGASGAGGGGGSADAGKGNMGVKVAQNNDGGKKAGGQKQTNGTPAQTAGTPGNLEAAGGGSTGSSGAGTSGEEDEKQGSFGDQGPKSDDKHKVSVNDGVIKVQKDDTINPEGNNMSFKDKVKSGAGKFGKAASIVGAAAVATYSKNDVLRQGAADYIGYDRGKDQQGASGYFGYQNFGTANDDISKASQQRQKQQEQQERERREQEKKQREENLTNELHRYNEAQRKMNEQIDEDAANSEETSNNVS